VFEKPFWVTLVVCCAILFVLALYSSRRPTGRSYHVFRHRSLSSAIILPGRSSTPNERRSWCTRSYAIVVSVVPRVSSFLYKLFDLTFSHLRARRVLPIKSFCFSFYRYCIRSIVQAIWTVIGSALVFVLGPKICPNIFLANIANFLVIGFRWRPRLAGISCNWPNQNFIRGFFFDRVFDLKSGRLGIPKRLFASCALHRSYLVPLRDTYNPSAFQHEKMFARTKSTYRRKQNQQHASLRIGKRTFMPQ